MKDKFIIVTGYQTRKLFAIRVSLIISIKQVDEGTKIITNHPDGTSYTVIESIQTLTKLINESL